MVSLMNSTTLAALKEAACFTLIHFVNLSIATKMCVTFGFLEWTYQIQPQCGKV
jgi:hypothetical protein